MSGNISVTWSPHPGMGGLMLSWGILISLISRGILAVETAHEILNEQISYLEELGAHQGTGDGARVHINAGLNDLLWLKSLLDQNPLTRLPN
jgi:hypothetical protein